jgi:hypothetical protein
MSGLVGRNESRKQRLARLFRMWRRAGRQRRGQGLVEFALVLPILILLVIGVMEFGYFFFVYSTVNTAAREAVRYAAGVGDSDNGVPYYQDCLGIREVATRIGRYANIQPGDVRIFYDDGIDETSGAPDNRIEVCAAMQNSHSTELTLNQRIAVEVDVNYSPIVLKGTLPDSIPIHSESARTIVVRLQVGN